LATTAAAAAAAVVVINLGQENHAYKVRGN
jgi:hypothetical protein